MEDFTIEELRWIKKQITQKKRTAVGVSLLKKIFDIERKVIKKINDITK